MFTFVEDMDNQAPFLSFYGVLISYPLMAFPSLRYCPPKFKVLDTAADRLWGCFSLIRWVWFQDSIHFWAAAGCSSALSRVFKGPSPASFDFLMDVFFLHTGKLPPSGPLAFISCSRPSSTAAPNFQPFRFFIPSAELLPGRVQD